MNGCIFAQLADLPYQYLSDPRHGVGNEGVQMEDVQALFIQELFVKHMLDSTELIEFDDDDEDFYNVSESNQMMNSILAREISKMLAKQDMLGLNDYKIE